MSDDNISVFFSTLMELARENNYNFNYGYNSDNACVHMCFNTKNNTFVGRIYIMEEDINDSAFPATYAKTLFRQMMRQR